MQKYSDDIEALQLAMQSEEEGYNFYSELSEKSENRLVKETFNKFAMDEVYHKKVINNFYESLTDGKEPDIHFSSENEGSLQKAKTIFENAEEKIGESARADADVVEPYKLAVKFERDGVDFYNKLRGKSKNSKTIKLYDYLTQMEAAHKEILDNMIDYLENPGMWFFENERWSIEG